MEERVQAGCRQIGQGEGQGPEEGPGKGWQLNSGWEAALANLRGRLQAACAAFSDCNSLRKLKDFALLSCTALGMSDYLLLATLTAVLITPKAKVTLLTAIMMSIILSVLCAVLVAKMAREQLRSPRACCILPDQSVPEHAAPSCVRF